MRRVTLQTIADLVGVSRMTVSNAFSRPDQLSSELRDRILAVASDLGYAGPDPAARGLARGTAGTVGIVLTDSLAWAFSDELTSRMAGAVATELAPTGKALTLLAATESDGFTPARDVALDGAIVHLCDDTSPAVDWLLKRRLPVVFVDLRPRPGHDSVNIDDEGGARSAARHVVELGHRRVGLIASSRGGETSWVDDPSTFTDLTNASRLRGWLDTLADGGATAAVVQTDLNDPGAAERATQLLLDADEPPTAMLCFSDVVAFGAIQAIRARGLRVPEDISVVGFDGTFLAERMDPPLTTVRQDPVEKGRAAARALVARMDGSTARARRVRLPVELVIGASTAPPPR